MGDNEPEITAVLSILKKFKQTELKFLEQSNDILFYFKKLYQITKTPLFSKCYKSLKLIRKNSKKLFQALAIKPEQIPIFPTVDAFKLYFKNMISLRKAYNKEYSELMKHVLKSYSDNLNEFLLRPLQRMCEYIACLQALFLEADFDINGDSIENYQSIFSDEQQKIAFSKLVELNDYFDCQVPLIKFGRELNHSGKLIIYQNEYNYCIFNDATLIFLDNEDAPIFLTHQEIAIISISDLSVEFNRRNQNYTEQSCIEFYSEENLQEFLTCVAKTHQGSFFEYNILNTESHFAPIDEESLGDSSISNEDELPHQPHQHHQQTPTQSKVPPLQLGLTPQNNASDTLEVPQGRTPRTPRTPSSSRTPRSARGKPERKNSKKQTPKSIDYSTIEYYQEYFEIKAFQIQTPLPVPASNLDLYSPDTDYLELNFL